MVEIEELLTAGEYGVMSTVAGDGQPYGVPLNYVYLDGHIYFHCAQEGHKLDNIAANNKVSFSVVGKTEVLADKFSTHFISAMVFGRAMEIQGTERQKAIEGLLVKYSPDYLKEGRAYAEKLDKATKIIKIEVTYYNGKRSPAGL